MTKQPAKRSIRGRLLRTGIALLGLVALAQGAPQGTEASEVFGQNRGSYGGSNRIVGPQSPFYNFHGLESPPNHSLVFPSGIFPTGLGLQRRTDLAALDLEITPKRTKVYLNGRLIGRSGQFDGHPDFLWLKEGIHQLAFYKEGYGTLVRDFNLHQGERIQVRIRLEPGEARLPGDPSFAMANGFDALPG